MKIYEIVTPMKTANDAVEANLKNQTKALKVKKAKLSADKAQQRVTAAQQRLRKAQTT